MYPIVWELTPEQGVAMIHSDVIMRPIGHAADVRLLRRVARVAASLVVLTIAVLALAGNVDGLRQSAQQGLPPSQELKLNEYAQATVRYFTSHEANNTVVGFTHSYYGTGPFQVYKGGSWQEEDWELTRGYGSYVCINEVTLRFLSLAAAYKMDWLGFAAPENRYADSWGQILIGLQTLRGLQLSGDPAKFYNGHFHRTYLTAESSEGDRDRVAAEIVCDPGSNLQSSDDSALPFMNLLVLEGLANDLSASIPDRAEIVQLCRDVRAAIDLEGFIVGDRIVHQIENDVPSALYWDRLSTEGAIILAALLLSGQIDEVEFETLATSLENHPVDWGMSGGGTLRIETPSYHSALFMHGLRAIHGMPAAATESPGLNYYANSTLPVFEAHLEFAQHNAYSALGTQVMSQALRGTPLYVMNGQQVQFPGNEANRMPAYGTSLSRATGPHAWFIPLQRAESLTSDQVTTLLAMMAAYESAFFHSGSDTQLGWEAAIPWTPGDTAYAWWASDGSWKYADMGRPFEALNAAYIVLSIFDALNPDAPLATYNVESEQTARIAFYLDNGSWPATTPTAAAFRVEPSGGVFADGSFYASGFGSGGADVAEWARTSEPAEPGDVLEADPEHPAFCRKSRRVGSRRIVGVVSTRPGIVLNSCQRAEGLVPIALIGIVPVKVTSEGGPVRAGDLLVSSSTPGHAMRWDERTVCDFVGKALEPMLEEAGLIETLIVSP